MAKGLGLGFFFFSLPLFVSSFGVVNGARGFW